MQGPLRTWPAPCEYMSSGDVEGVTLGSHVSSLGLSFVICKMGRWAGKEGWLGEGRGRGELTGNQGLASALSALPVGPSLPLS